MQGLPFSSPFVRTDADYVTYLRTRLPQASDQEISFIAGILYPPDFSGAVGYLDQIQRTAQTLGDLGFSCNTNYLARAYGNNTFNYFFSVPPALHGDVVRYTFFNGPNPMVLSDPTAIALQNYITSFAKSGNPNEPGTPVFNFYGNASEVQNLNGTFDRIRDPAASERCAWWQLALFADGADVAENGGNDGTQGQGQGQGQAQGQGQGEGQGQGRVRGRGRGRGRGQGQGEDDLISERRDD